MRATQVSLTLTLPFILKEIGLLHFINEAVAQSGQSTALISMNKFIHSELIQFRKAGVHGSNPCSLIFIRTIFKNHFYINNSW